MLIHLPDKPTLFLQKNGEPPCDSHPLNSLARCARCCGRSPEDTVHLPFMPGLRPPLRSACRLLSLTPSFPPLQETEELEEEKSGLQKEIAELQKEKEKLEFMLVAHGPVCKISPEERRSPPTSGLQSLRGTGSAVGPVVVKQEPPEEDSPSSSAGMDKTQRSVIKPISIAGGGFYGEEPLHTPIVVTSTPAITPGTSNLVFTYPSVLEQESPASPSESCSKAHRRSSSSGDQSSDSLNSPTLLAL